MPTSLAQRTGSSEVRVGTRALLKTPLMLLALTASAHSDPLNLTDIATGSDPDPVAVTYLNADGRPEVPNQSTCPGLRAMLKPFPAEDRSTVVYRGFRIDVPESSGDRHVTIRKGGRLLVRWPKPNPELEGRGWAAFGLLPLLGRPDSQLVLFNHDGGVHSAPSLRIYDLESPLRLLFDSDTYSYQDGHADEGWSDLDGDGLPEVVIHTAAFAYMYETPYSASPFPPLIFKYDAESRRYRLANGSFDKLLLRATEESTNDSENASFSIDRMLTYIYAGHADEAWKMFDRLYTRRDKETMASEIRKVLAQDPAYRELYEPR